MNRLENFREYLEREEKSAATTEKYLRDCRAFLIFMGEQEMSNANMTTPWGVGGNQRAQT